MIRSALYNKLADTAAFAVLFLCIAAAIWTGNYLILFVPFIFLFALLAGVNWKTAYWVMLFIIPFSFLIYLGPLSTTLPDEPMMWMFLLLFLFMWARNPAILPEWWWRNPLVFIIVLQFLWMLVAVIFSKELLFSVKFSLAKVWFLVSFLVFPIFIFRTKKDLKTGFLVLLVPIVITMIIIMIRHGLAGFNFRRVDRSINPIYFNHVEYSTVISMFLPLVYVAYMLTKGRTGLRSLFAGLILFFIVAIYLSYARAAMLAVGFSLFIAILMRFRLLNFLMPGFYVVMILLVGYMVRNNKYIDFRPVFHKTYMHRDFTDHVISTFKGQDMSSMERLYRWVAGVRMSNDNPITGVGPNGFYYHYKPYAVSSFRTYVSRNPEGSTTHNYFLLMLVEQGWPAMILYGILLVVVFAQAQKIYYRFKDRFYKACVMGIIMMFGAGFINNFFSELLETHKVGCLFFISIALLIILDKKSKDEQKALAQDPNATMQ
jgi:O-antigen ligase